MILTNRIRVVLLPGLHGTSDLFNSFLRQCPSEFEPITIEFPRDRALSYEVLADEVQSRVKSSTPTVLVGESFSGPLALRLASEWSEGLIAVVLVASFVLPPAPSWLRFFPWRSLFHMRTPLYLLRTAVAGSLDEAEVLAKASRILGGISADALASRLRSTLTVDARPWLASCPSPILYLAGAKDRLIRRHCLNSILRCRPDVVCRTLQTTHFVLQLAPDDAWEAITSFLQTEKP
ncbi:MAG: alpha/beta hydrolase [Verrucomicrobia bacterium]|nr:alpha/beta hydrolase [Verrucomicrobiota bacterium]